MKTIREKIGAEVRSLRLSRKMTVRELAEVSGLGYTHISSIENGKYNVRLDTLEQLGNALGVTLTFIDINK